LTQTIIKTCAPGFEAFKDPGAGRKYAELHEVVLSIEFVPVRERTTLLGARKSSPP
jgi:hypothetical protein